MVVDSKDAPTTELFDINTKAIIWGMQPRAVQVLLLFNFLDSNTFLIS